ncbi:response regulator [Patescibacteria group bacterium]|nr:response regulator [Patescibacteria group bacterium]
MQLMALHEKILIANDSDDLRQKMVEYLTGKEQDIVAEASGLGEVMDIVDSGLNFTVAILDQNMPEAEAGTKAAAYIRDHRQGVTIISAAGAPQTFGDINFPTGQPRPSQLIEAINSIQH